MKRRGFLKTLAGLAALPFVATFAKPNPTRRLADSNGYCINPDGTEKMDCKLCYPERIDVRERRSGHSYRFSFVNSRGEETSLSPWTPSPYWHGKAPFVEVDCRRFDSIVNDKV